MSDDIVVVWEEVFVNDVFEDRGFVGGLRVNDDLINVLVRLDDIISREMLGVYNLGKVEGVVVDGVED